MRLVESFRAVAARLFGPPPQFAETASGRRVYVAPGDERAAALINARGNFNPPTLALWRQLVAERAWTHIVDVGANYGEMLVDVAFPESAAILAIEPNPHLVPWLKRTLRDSGVKAEVITSVVSDRDGTAKLQIDRTWSGMSSVVPDQEQVAGHVLELREMPSATLTSLIRARPQGLLNLLVKIDVEGHEIAVLRGVEELLPQAENFAALVEVLHLPDADLDWLLSRFTVMLLDQQSGALVAAPAASTHELRGLLAVDRFYRNDAVLRLR